MKKIVPIAAPAAALLLILVALGVRAAEDPAEVETVVAATKEAHPDNAKLCQAGQPGILNAVSMQVKALAMAGKVNGNQQALGVEASAQIGKECFGGG